MKTLAEIKIGETFKLGDVNFIKFADNDGATTAVTKDIVFRSDFGKNNNLANMKIIKRLEKEFLPSIIATVGEESILDIETDLTTLDGLKTFGTITSKVSLPTLEFYRENVEIFDKYKLNDWYWLATAWSTLPHYDSSLVLCVGPSGIGVCNSRDGVRPLLNFKSSIFVSEV